MGEAGHSASELDLSRLRGLFDDAPIGIFHTTVDGRLAAANLEVARMFGWPSPAAMCAEISDVARQLFVEPERRVDILRAVLSQPGFIHVENPYRRRDGTTFDSMLHLRAVRDAAGQVLFLEGFIEDISDRKRAEAEIRRSEERLRLHLEQTPLAAIELDLQGGVVHWNRAAAATFGFTEAEVLGRPLSALAPPEDGGPLEEVLARMRAGGPGERHVQGHLSRHGRRLRMEWSHTPIRRPDGTVLGIFSLGTDVTEREQLRDALEAEKERLAVTLRSIGDGVVATDLEERVVLLNHAAEQLTAWTTPEAAGRPLAEVLPLLHADTRQPCESPVRRVLDAQGVVALPGPTLLRARDGAERVIADSGAPIRDREGRLIGVVLAFRDVTQQAKVEQALARTQKLESLAVLAGGIAHDFNNLLAGILGNVSFARADAPPGGELAEALADAELAALRARDLTHQLLTFSRGGAPMKRRVDLSALAEETARLVTRGSTVACRFDLLPGLFAEADEGQIGQVLQNLLLNAVQAMPAGGTVSVTGARLELPAGNPFGLPPGAYARLAVRDEGVGIPASVLPRIFDPFFTTKPDGRGLGLAISHSIVERHEGHLAVASLPGTGTTFEAYLPLSAAAPGPAAAEHGQAQPGKGPRQRVLVVDDQEMVRRLAERVLRTAGHDVVGAPDGRTATALYREALAEGRRFTAVILDLTIPGGMGAREALAHLRALDPAVRAVASSGYADDPIMAHHAEYGFCGVLRKPYGAQELCALVERLAP